MPRLLLSHIATVSLLLAGSINPAGLFARASVPYDEPSQKEDAPEKQSRAKGKGDERDLGEEKDPDLSLKVSGSNAVFAAERDLAKGLSEAANLKKKAKLAIKPLRDTQAEISDLETRMLESQQQLVALNAQLANVSDVATNNRLVGAINTVDGQMALAIKKMENLKAREIAARSSLNKAREEFVSQVLNLRELADQITQAYETAADSPELQAELKTLQDDSGKPLTLQPSAAVQSSQKKLAELETSIQTERITLRREGNTFYASVVVNGKHTEEMVVDTGASLIMLPYEVAVTMGLKPDGKDKQILLTLADGSRITGYLKVLDSVRIGTFVAEKVQCAVLGPEAVAAEPLLGMSFLGEFQFHIDAADGTLGLTQIETDTGSGSRRKN